MNPYTIYLVNSSASTKVFWCFLGAPDELSNDNVYANSSVSLAVTPNYPGVNTFTIPVQYVVGAGGSNNAVGLDVLINSQNVPDVNLGQGVLAIYATVPPRQGPTFSPGTSVDANSIGFQVNNFNQVSNEINNWYSSASFGIQTEQGFVGMTWSPSPNDSTTITPKLTFYVATGSFESCTLADFTMISTYAAEVPLTAFLLNAATVTLTATGDWQVTPGAPSSSLLESHAGSAAPVRIESALPRETQSDKVRQVVWDGDTNIYGGQDSSGRNLTVLSGRLTVGVGLTAAFTGFVLAGIKFSITSAKSGDRSFRFSYDGTRSASFVTELFQKAIASGKDILLS